MKCAGITAVVVLCLGCSKAAPPSGASTLPVTPVAAGDGDPVVVVGDPTHMPGRFGGPCKNEDCGHESCVASRKFIADAHPCAVCEKPIVWGDEIVVFFTDGITSRAAGGGGRTDGESKWQNRLNEIDLLCHEKCRQTTKCAICDLELAMRNQKFHVHDGKLCHDGCYEYSQKKQQASTIE